MLRFTACYLCLAAALIVGNPVPGSNPQPKAEITAKATDEVAMAQYLQEISVLVDAGRYSGSGVLRVTSDKQVWVLTCGHVIEDLRHVEDNVVTFDDATVYIEDRVDGEIVAKRRYIAEVVRYSDPEIGEDLALLRLKSDDLKPKNSVKFNVNLPIPKVGDRIYHCGCYLGKEGYNSFAVGYIAQVGRFFEWGSPKPHLYDQVGLVAYPGSSGGIVCDKNGYYLGTLVRGKGENFNVVVPFRRIKSWAKSVGIMFILDDSLKIPLHDKLMADGIEKLKKK